MKINIFRVLPLLRFRLRSCFPCVFHLLSLLKSLPFWRARFASFGSIVGVMFDGLGNILAPKTLQEAFQDASKQKRQILMCIFMDLGLF